MMKGSRKSKWSRISLVGLITLFILAPVVFTPQPFASDEIERLEAVQLNLPDIPELVHDGKYIPLHLASGTIDPLLQPLAAIPGLPQLTIESIPPGESAYFIVQMKGPITDEQKQNLIKAGGQIFDYIHEFAFIVKMNAATRATIEYMESVRWVGIYQPGYRIYPQLMKDYVLTEASEPATLVIVLFKGEDLSKI